MQTGWEFCKTQLLLPYSGLYSVLERGNKAGKVQVGERVKILSRDRPKPHLGSVAPKAAVPPKRGRPRTASVASVASASLAAKTRGPVYCVAARVLKTREKIV